MFLQVIRLFHFFSIELGIWQSLYFIFFLIFDDDFIRWQRVIVQRIKEHMVLLKNIYDFLEGLNNIFISVALTLVLIPLNSVPFLQCLRSFWFVLRWESYKVLYSAETVRNGH